jgi:hypothetical protein
VNQFLWGATAALSAIAALFFGRFWHRTRDRLFAHFALGFALLALHWLTLGVLNPGDETRHYVYFVRFLAFALFIAGVVSKNRRG